MNEHIREGRGSIPGLFAQPKRRVGAGDWLDAVRRSGMAGRGLGDDTTTMDPNAGGSSYPPEITQTGTSTPIDPSSDPEAGGAAPVVAPSAPVTSTTTTTYPPVVTQTGTSTPVGSSSTPAATDNTTVYVVAGGIAAAAGVWWWLSHSRKG